MRDDIGQLLASCHADDIAGARTWPEWREHAARRLELVKECGRYAASRRYPRVTLEDGTRIGPGSLLWCDFLFGCQSAIGLFSAMLALDDAPEVSP